MGQGLREKLERAWGKGDIKFLKRYLTRGNVNLIFDGQILLFQSVRYHEQVCSESCLDCFELALRLGANTRTYGIRGSTPLTHAIRYEADPKLVDMLIQADKESVFLPEKNGLTPLGVAAYRSDLSKHNLERITLALLENCPIEHLECHVPLYVRRKATPLTKALYEGNEFCAKMLILFGASLDKVDVSAIGHEKITPDIIALYEKRKSVTQSTLIWLAFSRHTPHGKKLVCKDMAMIIAKEIWSEIERMKSFTISQSSR